MSHHISWSPLEPFRLVGLFQVKNYLFYLFIDVNNKNNMWMVVTIADGDSSSFFEGLVSLPISNLLSTSWKQTREDCTFGSKMAQQIYWNAAWTTRCDLTNMSYRRRGFCPEAGRRSLWHFPSKPNKTNADTEQDHQHLQSGYHLACVLFVTGNYFASVGKVKYTMSLHSRVRSRHSHLWACSDRVWWWRTH